MSDEIEGGLKEKVMSRITANSGNIDYGEEIVLRSNSRSQLVFLPYYIQNKHVLSGKIILYKNRAGRNQEVWGEENSITLDEESTTNLIDALCRTDSLVKAGLTGRFLSIPLGDEDAIIDGSSLDDFANLVTSMLSHRELVERISDQRVRLKIAESLRGFIKIWDMEDAIAKLREMLDSGVVLEREYQAWCDLHAWSFGLSYLDPDKLRRISAGDTIDLMMPAVMTGLRDIVELKRPDMEAMKFDHDHKSFYYGSDASRAIGQAARYLDVLHDEARTGLRDHPEVVAYHPRATVVIGRSSNWSEDWQRGLHGLNARLSGITVMTYDHLLAQGERILSMLRDEEKINPD